MPTNTARAVLVAKSDGLHDVDLGFAIAAPVARASAHEKAFQIRRKRKPTLERFAERPASFVERWAVERYSVWQLQAICGSAQRLQTTNDFI